MNKFLLIIMVFVTVPYAAVASPITTYAVNPIVTAPQGDEIDGAIVEAFVIQGMVIQSTVANITFTLNTEFLIQGMLIHPSVGNLDFWIVTKAINPIWEAPQGDEIDGAWLEAFTMHGIIVAGKVVELAFTRGSEFIMQGVMLQPIVSNYGAIKWESGVEWADGTYWENVEIIMIVPDGGSVDVIVWGGF